MRLDGRAKLTRGYGGGTFQGELNQHLSQHVATIAHLEQCKADLEGNVERLETDLQQKREFIESLEAKIARLNHQLEEVRTAPPTTPCVGFSTVYWTPAAPYIDMQRWKFGRRACGQGPFSVPSQRRAPPVDGWACVRWRRSSKPTTMRIWSST
jgi:hypothetical protein